MRGEDLVILIFLRCKRGEGDLSMGSGVKMCVTCYGDRSVGDRGGGGYVEMICTSSKYHHNVSHQLIFRRYIHTLMHTHTHALTISTKRTNSNGLDCCHQIQSHTYFIRSRYDSLFTYRLCIMNTNDTCANPFTDFIKPPKGPNI